MSPILEVKNVTVRYPHASHNAIEDISFELKPESITALIGPNGSGKSTLLKAILGFVPFKGKIRLNDRDVREQLNRIGYVPQRFSFDTSFPITVHEFLHLSCAQKSFDDEISTLMEEVNMKGKDRKLLSALSGGQLQRILLVRSLLQNPQLLILDEPEAGVDVGGEQSFYTLLQKLVTEKHLTVLIATHELDIVHTFADNVLCINQKLVCTGTQNVLTQEMFQNLYGHHLKFYGHHHDKT
ncbi:metal ABC transporter ATP-binding protein [Candidatus Roizmanbacteria bacterium]|nr:MAG: metal ABC transporter ATP-binding protein [Candidatus Roizmanbacteria bacterium]